MSKHPTRRSGSSLVELTVVLSVSSSIALLAIGWIHQSMKLATVIRNHDRHHQSVTRLARDFRDDAHFATSATIQDQRTEFRISENETITYEILGSTVQRQRIRNVEQVDNVVAYESYPLAEHSAVSVDAGELPQWVSITVERANPGKVEHSTNVTEPHSVTRPIDLSVRAAVGRLRFEEQP